MKKVIFKKPEPEPELICVPEIKNRDLIAAVRKEPGVLGGGYNVYIVSQLSGEFRLTNIKHHTSWSSDSFGSKEELVNYYSGRFNFYVLDNWKEITKL